MPTLIQKPRPIRGEDRVVAGALSPPSVTVRKPRSDSRHAFVQLAPTADSHLLGGRPHGLLGVHLTVAEEEQLVAERRPDRSPSPGCWVAVCRPLPTR